MNSIKTLVLIAFRGIACSPTHSTDRTCDEIDAFLEKTNG